MDQNNTPPAHPIGPATPEAFVADRQRMWSGFTQLVFYGVIALVVLLILMALFIA